MGLTNEPAYGVVIVKTILTVVDHYLPGYKSGGPVRSTVNLVDCLGSEFRFAIVTTDRDLGDSVPYAGIIEGEWQAVGKARVLYLSPEHQSLLHWRRLLVSTDYDLLYLNGLFSRNTIRILALRRLGLLARRAVILAPRGELSKSALALKAFKKRSFVALARLVALYANVVWQASNVYEAEQIRDVFGDRIHQGRPDTHIASDLPSSAQVVSGLPAGPWTGGQVSRRPRKETGKASIVFVSRISRMKNLDFALRLLGHLSGVVQFDIYGPIEDEVYWRHCQEIIRSLPDHVRVDYRGSLLSDQVSEVFRKYHLFLFPTRGESFGHVVLEAMLSGCPVLVSDETPWRDLFGKGAGWSLPLTDAGQFSEALQDFVAMDSAAFRRLSRNALAAGRAFATDPAIVEASRSLFLR